MGLAVSQQSKSIALAVAKGIKISKNAKVYLVIKIQIYQRINLENIEIFN